jgi:hypothetical protein
MKLMAVWLFSISLLSCRKNEYRSVFKYPFTKKQELKDHGFQPISLSMADNPFINNNEAGKNKLPASLTKKIEDDEWMWKQVGDTVVHYQFIKGHLVQKTIDVRSRGKSLSAMQDAFLEKGFTLEDHPSDSFRKVIMDPYLKQKFILVHHTRGLSFFQYFK